MSFCHFLPISHKETRIKSAQSLLLWNFFTWKIHCVKSVQIRSFFWSVFSCIQSEYRKIPTRKSSSFGLFSHSDINNIVLVSSLFSFFANFRTGIDLIKLTKIMTYSKLFRTLIWRLLCYCITSILLPTGTKTSSLTVVWACSIFQVSAGFHIGGVFVNYKSSYRRCSIKNMFLNILQQSKENTCVGVPFLIKL